MTKTEYSRQRRKALKEQGLCTQCGVNPASGRGSSCEYCRGILTFKSRMNRAFMKDHGLCQTCGKREAIPGTGRCAECRDKNILRSRMYYRHNKAGE